MTGSFVYDATTNTFVSWTVTVTAGQDSSGNQFSALTYSNTIAGDTAGPGGFNGAGFYDFSLSSSVEYTKYSIENFERSCLQSSPLDSSTA